MIEIVDICRSCWIFLLTYLIKIFEYFIVIGRTVQPNNNTIVSCISINKSAIIGNKVSETYDFFVKIQTKQLTIHEIYFRDNL